MHTRIFFAVVIAAALVVTHQVESTSGICDSPKCIQAAGRIIDYVDTSTNPCGNFYQFACGNFLKKSFGNEKLQLNRKIKDQHSQMMIEIYQEDIHEDDHKMVKVGKQLYQKCIDKKGVQNDLKTIKEVIKKIGGWPVLEGSSWKEDNFDWLNATYELRRLGYAFSAFLDLRVEQDEDNIDKHIFQLDGSGRGHTFIRPYAKPEDMAKVAVLIGAKNEEMAIKDLTGAAEILKKLEEIKSNSINSHPLKKQTVQEIQKTDGVINWLEFINNLLGPKVQISKDDYILAPTNQYLTQVIEVISQIPKRTQANYIMWKVVAPLLRFFPTCPSNYRICDRWEDEAEEREMFCLRQIHGKLITAVPNPIDVIRLRRHLSEDKKRKVENFVLKVKSEFLELVGKLELVPKQTLDMVNEAKVIIGMPENYLDDKLLDESDVDMASFQDNTTFFTLLGQVNKNLQTAEYIKVESFKPESLYGAYIANNAIIRYYYYGANILHVPVTAAYLLYDEYNPEYLNYGTLGTLIASELGQVLMLHLERETVTSFRHCLSQEIKNNSISDSEKRVMLRTTAETILAEEISYAAYEKWVKNNGEELKLVGTNYTANQLFWISATSLLCQPIGASKFSHNRNDLFELHSNIYAASAALRHHNKFATDFNCPVNSKMNVISNKCNIL